MDTFALPDAAYAFVEEKKITGYWPSDSYPQGRSKARYFRAFGFAPERWEDLAAALCRQGAEGKIVGTLNLADSTQYSVEGALTAPDGRCPQVRTVWETRPSAMRPRLITAYPAR